MGINRGVCPNPDCDYQSTWFMIRLYFGCAGALVLTEVLTTMLFGIEPTDGVTFVAVAMVLIAVAAIAALV